MSNWDEQFKPILAQGREVREGQRTLGNAIIQSVDKGGNVVAQASTGTGKSFAALIPMITAVNRAKAAKKTYRGVISTETLTLQGQIFLKDLPYLQKTYGGFTYAKLMGRSNYLCLNAAEMNAVGVSKIDAMVNKLKARIDNLGDGELSDVERVLGRELATDEWAKLAGSSSFCGDNQCNDEKCFSTRARARAKSSDIVVANHAVVATDLEMRLSGSMAGEDGLLGTFECLIIDEAHQLEPVLKSQWTKELTSWELSSMNASVTEGVSTAQKVAANEAIGRNVAGAMDDLSDMFKNIQNFYSLLAERDGQKWKGSSQALSLKYLSGNPPQFLMNAMNEYEQETPVRLANAEAVLTKAIEYLMKATKQAREEQIKGMRKANKGLRAAKDLLDIVQIVSKGLETRDGIINQYGVYGATVDGWEKRDGTQGMTLRLVPLDVSAKAQYLWHTKTNILLSATLTDLTDGSFKYAKACVGFPANAKEVDVSTPFDLATQQVVYITPATGEVTEDVRGAQFDFSEMVDLINAARGRSLILFTSRQELDWAANQLVQLRNMGKFKWPILVQESDSKKDKLMEEFKSNIDSVLLATKSFFVGIDVPGESLSLVALAKFPLPRYSVECKQSISYWRTRKFPRWYEREALTTLQQAAGRLIRSSGCKGVVAVLDFRVADSKTSVYKTARIGVDAIGSPVTRDINYVKQFLAA